MHFTFYGDLIGISANYRLNPDDAFQNLSIFYNATFDTFKPYLDANSTAEIYMFSDSLIVCGDNAAEALPYIQRLYLELVCLNLLFLRGAIVDGKLQFDPRIDKYNFNKNLPKGTELVRAVGLAGKHKGARLLVEPKLAASLLRDVGAWSTISGYFKTIRQDIESYSTDLRRRIIPTRDSYAYEYLYFWELDGENSQCGLVCAETRMKILEMRKFNDKNVNKHFTDTVDVLDRSLDRQQLTQKYA